MKFDQLSEVAKDKARQWWIDGDDQPLETDYIVESLEAIGFIDAEIFYRISDDLRFNSQCGIVGLKAKGRARNDNSGFVITI